MKKYLIFLTLVLALSLGAFGVGCAGGSEVTFAEDEIVLGRYEERQLEVVYDGKEKLSWSSSDESIVTVTDVPAVNIVGLVLLGIAAALTIVSGVNYVVKNREVLKEEKKEK